MTSRAMPSIVRPLGRSPSAAVERDRGLDRRDGRGLGTRHDLVDLEIACRRLADEQRPGHVAPIAGDLGAEVEEQHRAVDDRPIARRAVRQRGLGPGQAGDVEGERLGAAGPDQPFEPEREVGLGGARLDLGEQRGQRPIGDGAGGGDALDLGRLLDRPVGLDPALDRHELDVRRGRGEAPPHRLRDEARLDRDPARPDRRHQLGPAGRQVVVGLDDARVGRFAPGLDRVARVGEDRDVLGTDQELARVAGDLLLALAEGEPGQVAHVLAADPEIGVDPGVGEALPQAREPRRPGGAVGLGPAGVIGRRRASAPKSAGSGPRGHWM